MQDFINPYRDTKHIQALSSKINKISSNLQEKLYIMEVCGGHTHTLMKYGLKSLLDSTNISFMFKKEHFK